MPTADELAALLCPDDFSAVGLAGAGAPTVNANGGPRTVYAVYAGRSAADGGIELDVFISDTPEEAATLVQDPGLYELDAPTKQELGADRATLIADASTNDGTAAYDVLWGPERQAGARPGHRDHGQVARPGPCAREARAGTVGRLPVGKG